MNSYRIIYKICSTEREAKAKCKDVVGKVKAPSVVYSKRTGAWIVQLYKSWDRNLIDKAYAYYKSRGLVTNIQKVDE